jgi:hypothetical protein
MAAWSRAALDQSACGVVQEREETVAMTGIVELLVLLAIIGLVAWVLVSLVPMPSQIRTVIIVVAVLICLLVVLRAFGGIDVPLVRTG